MKHTGLDKFLQPQSMTTPGVLGAIAMAGTNALGAAFGVPSGSWGYSTISLVLSFLFGLTALVKSTSFMEKVGYYSVNSMIIFCVAFGSNAIGTVAQQHAFLQPSTAYAASPTALKLSPRKVQFFKQWAPSRNNTSTTCLFTSGPRAGQWQDLSPHPPMEIGAPCTDGHSSSGKVIAAPTSR